MLNTIKDMLVALEGPYKWYAMMLALSVISLIVTKTFFKALKWMLLVAGIIIAIFVIAHFSSIIQY